MSLKIAFERVIFASVARINQNWLKELPKQICKYQNMRQHWYTCTSTYNACTSAEVCQNKHQIQLFEHTQIASFYPLFPVCKWLGDQLWLKCTLLDRFFHCSIAVFAKKSQHICICPVKFARCVKTSISTVLLYNISTYILEYSSDWQNWRNWGNLFITICTINIYVMHYCICRHA